MEQTTIDSLRDSYAQLLYLCGILAGFSFTVVTQLLGVERRRLVSALLSVYLGATAMFLAAISIGCFALIRLRPGTAISESQFYTGFGAVALATGAGILLFLAGLGMAGFLYSRRMGAMAIAAALLAILSAGCGVFYILVDFRTL